MDVEATSSVPATGNTGAAAAAAATAATAGAAAPPSFEVPPSVCCDRGRLGCARLPRRIGLADCVLFLWCGRVVTAARRKGRLDAGDAAAALPPGARSDIDDQVRILCVCLFKQLVCAAAVGRDCTCHSEVGPHCVGAKSAVVACKASPPIRRHPFINPTATRPIPQNKHQLGNGPAWVHPARLRRPVCTATVFFHHRRWLLLRAALALLVVGIRLTVPIMLRGFVRFLDKYDKGKATLTTPPLWQGWIWAAGLVAFSLAAIVTDAASTWNTQAHTNTLRMQLGAALSAKALRLGGAEMAAVFGAGRLLNAFSSDARRVSELNMLLEFLVTAPLVTAAAFLMIALEAGPVAAAVSIAVYLLALPLVVSGGGTLVIRQAVLTLLLGGREEAFFAGVQPSSVLQLLVDGAVFLTQKPACSSNLPPPTQFLWSHLIAQLRIKSAAAADERLRLLEECLVGVAAVKALRAEGEVERRVSEARAREVWALQKIALLKALNYSLQVRRLNLAGCWLAGGVGMCMSVQQPSLFFD